MSLTGGLDTRMILAWNKFPSGSLPCYTYGGMFRECRDILVARQVARACRQPHSVIPVGEEFLSRFPRYAERTVYLTDGTAAVNRSADLYLNERAREIAPVRMTGNYGGEVLRRIRAFKPGKPLPGLFGPDLLPFDVTSVSALASGSFEATRFRLLYSSRLPGTITVSSRWKRRSWPSGRRTLTTSLSRQSFAHRSLFSRTTMFACG